MKVPLFFFFAFLIALWAGALWHLSALWLAFPQYHYGFAVPFICVYLVLKKWLAAAGPKNGDVEAGQTMAEAGSWRERFGDLEKGEVRWPVFALLGAACLLLLPVRVVHEANPLWRLTSWALVVLVVTVTLCAIFMTGGRRWLREYAFPVLFILVAVPWPSAIELPAIQALAGANTAVSVEILNGLGIPAIRHANVVEISAGMVGVDDACSGVRSVQSTLMLALFFGELFRLRLWERLVCAGGGLSLAFGFNVARTVLLTWVAARDGVGSIARWHDPTSVAIALMCFVFVAAVAVLFRPEELKRRWAEFVAGELPEERRVRLAREREENLRKEKKQAERLRAEKERAGKDEPGREAAEKAGQNVETLIIETVEIESKREGDDMGAEISGAPTARPQGCCSLPAFNFIAFQRFAVVMLVWVLVVEVGTEAWYRVQEGPSW